MKQRMDNYLEIVCDDVNFFEVSNIEFYVRQGAFFRQYAPHAVQEHALVIKIPFEDAMELDASFVRLQFAYLDADGTPRASEVQSVSAGALLKEAGYDPL